VHGRVRPIAELDQARARRRERLGFPRDSAACAGCGGGC
jgi:hypothetical protein